MNSTIVMTMTKLSLCKLLLISIREWTECLLYWMCARVVQPPSQTYHNLSFHRPKVTITENCIFHNGRAFHTKETSSCNIIEGEIEEDENKNEIPKLSDWGLKVKLPRFQIEIEIGLRDGKFAFTWRLIISGERENVSNVVCSFDEGDVVDISLLCVTRNSQLRFVDGEIHFRNSPRTRWLIKGFSSHKILFFGAEFHTTFSGRWNSISRHDCY